MKAYLNKKIREQEQYLETLYSGNISKMFYYIENEPPPEAKGKITQWKKLVRGASIEYELMRKNNAKKT